uniref:Ig-like domain-containing protein n=1 Tax=Ditylenchus dipsaci TaxID=166011 RepID=A0A915E3Y4_9BILA
MSCDQFRIDVEVINSTTQLSLDPLGVGADRSVYIVKAGYKFIVACEYNGDEVADEHSVQWINEASVPIEPSISILTQARQINGRIKRSLIFVKIQKHDAGEYKCRAELRNGEFVTRSIHVIVLSNIDWNTPSNQVGGVLGDSLTIDCGLKVSQPLLLRSRTRLSFQITNSEVTIEQLTKEHQGLKLRCLAVQTINVNNEFNTTTTDVHELVVDVWYKPEFEYTEVERYAIAHKNVSLLCLDKEILYNHERYEVIPNVESQASVLKIDYIEERDFGRYKCVVSNGKMKAEQIIILKKTKPPKQPTVSVEQVSNSSIIFRIVENREDGDLPVLSYSIIYTLNKKRALDSPTERRSVIRQRNEANLYEIYGLEPFQEYEFLVYPKSEAGQGDPVLVKDQYYRMMNCVITSWIIAKSVSAVSSCHTSNETQLPEAKLLQFSIYRQNIRFLFKHFPPAATMKLMPGLSFNTSLDARSGGY